MQFLMMLRQQFPQFAQQSRGKFMQQDAEEFMSTLFNTLAMVGVCVCVCVCGWMDGWRRRGGRETDRASHALLACLLARAGV
jgi:hypothetical protein